MKKISLFATLYNKKAIGSPIAFIIFLIKLLHGNANLRV